MKIECWVIGKNTPDFVEKGVQMYAERIKHYNQLKYVKFNAVKNANKLSHEILRKKEGEEILKKLSKQDYLIILDEKGKEYRSLDFAEKINKIQFSGKQRVIFLIGGAFGFDDNIYSRANELLSLGKGTYSHQVIRIMFLEQLYRAFTILKNEKYHNE